MNANFILYIALGCLVLLAVLAVWLTLIELRLKKIFRGKKGKDLEDILSAINEELKKLHLNQEQTENYLKEVEERLKKSLKQVGIVRFNPFNETGSNQSFSVALLDENGNGVVISALYSREQIRVYAKPVQNYKSEYTLSEEENEAIRKTQK